MNFLRKCSEAPAVNFINRTLRKYLKQPLFKIHKIIRIQQKNMILIGLFEKVISFQVVKECRRATSFNFDKYAIIRIFEKTFDQHTRNNTRNRQKYMVYSIAVSKRNCFSAFNKIQKSYCR